MAHSTQECCGRWTQDGRYYLFESGAGQANNIFALADSSQHFPQSFRDAHPTDDWPDPVLNGSAGHSMATSYLCRALSRAENSFATTPR